jgi:hypothetical protein
VEKHKINTGIARIDSFIEIKKIPMIKERKKQQKQYKA